MMNSRCLWCYRHHCMRALCIMTLLRVSCQLSWHHDWGHARASEFSDDYGATGTMQCMPAHCIMTPSRMSCQQRWQHLQRVYAHQQNERRPTVCSGFSFESSASRSAWRCFGSSGFPQRRRRSWRGGRDTNAECGCRGNSKWIEILLHSHLLISVL